MTIPAYPLQWPEGWKRTPSFQQIAGKFGKQERQYRAPSTPGGSSSSWLERKAISIADAVERVRAELKRMGVGDDDLVISTNLQLRLDGFPKSGQAQPSDAGVAVYWRDGKEMRCMAIDRYERVEHNLAAIAATLDAMRAIERHGGAEILNRAFTGFNALPAPEGKRWWDVLGVPANARTTEIEAAYRRRRSEAHPDNGGSVDEFDAVQRAFEEATR